MHYLILFFCKTKEQGKDWNNLQVKGVSEERCTTVCTAFFNLCLKTSVYE